jgi:hypothetical protein
VAAGGADESLGERLARSPVIRVELEQILLTSYLLMSKLVTALVPLNLIAAISYASAASSCVPIEFVMIH